MSVPTVAPPSLRGFPPILGERPRVLILGSFPSPASLERGEYYAHPRNAFWRILGDLGLVDAATDYPTRIAALRTRPVALWDTIATCVRPGSLDSAIVPTTVEPNDIAALLAAHPTIGRVLLNGGTAWTMWRRHHRALAVPAVRVPSTSPAHASLCYADKLARWRRELAAAGVPTRAPV